MSQQKIYAKRKMAYKKQNLEHNCVLQESGKTVRRWQRSILLVKGGHCVGIATLHGRLNLFEDAYTLGSF